MTEKYPVRSRLLNGWRVAGWGAAAALLLLPAVAMRFTSEVDWTPGDFLAAALMLLFLGGAIELAVRVARTLPGRAGLMIAGFAAFFTFWVNGAVGLIGSEDEMLNLGFYWLVLVALLATLFAWFQPAPMRWIMGAMALAQPLMGALALWTMPGHSVEWGVLVFFGAIWMAAAACFHRAVKFERAYSAPCPPVEPNPPAPRSVASSSSTSRHSPCVTGETTNCAIRSPRWIGKLSSEWLIRITFSSPR